MSGNQVTCMIDRIVMQGPTASANGEEYVLEGDFV